MSQAHGEESRLPPVSTCSLPGPHWAFHVPCPAAPQDEPGEPVLSATFLPRW